MPLPFRTISVFAMSRYAWVMADIINLRQVRKAKARADAEKQADANRAKFGRSKAERQAALAEAARQAKLLDGAKRTPDE